MDQDTLLREKQSAFNRLTDLILETPECRQALLREWKKRKSEGRSTAKLSESYGSTQVEHSDVGDRVEAALDALEQGDQEAFSLLKSARISVKMYQRMLEVPIADLSQREKLSKAWDHYIRVRNQIVSQNMGLVLKFSGQLQSRGGIPDDMVQEGCLGLIRAVEKYNPDLGIKLSSYASWWIRQYIRRYLRNVHRSIRLPHHIHDQLSKVKGAERSLSAALDRPPKLTELSLLSGLESEQVENLLQIHNDVVSLEAPAKGEYGRDTIKDVIPSNNEVSIEQQHRLRSCLHSLPAKAREVIVSLYYADPPLACWEVARDLGISEREVEEIRDKALQHFREELP